MVAAAPDHANVSAAARAIGPARATEDGLNDLASTGGPSGGLRAGLFEWIG